MTNLQPTRFLDRAERAWDEGYAIVASRVNAIIVPKGAKPVGAAVDPPEGVTLEKSRDRMIRALEALKPDADGMSSDLRELKRLWPLGFGEWVADEQRLSDCLDGLAQLRCSPEEWNNAFVRPMQERASKRREEWQTWLAGFREYLLGLEDEPGEVELFVPGPVQRRILKALDGKALKVEPLATTIGVETSRLYRGDGLDELKEKGLVDHKPGLGYYRVDAPPDFAIKMRKRRGKK